MNGFISGFKGGFSPKGIGSVAFVFAVLVIVYAFAPQFSPQAVAAKIGSATGSNS